jgi:hypothetical protein
LANADSIPLLNRTKMPGWVNSRNPAAFLSIASTSRMSESAAF